MEIKEITKCRVCGSSNLVTILDLGEQVLTGVFPKIGEEIPTSPVKLVKCKGECGLTQLSHSVEPDVMYGLDYGYRSGLNKAMVNHLNNLVDDIIQRVELRKGDCFCDIAANDGSLIKRYLQYQGVGNISPTRAAGQSYYKMTRGYLISGSELITRYENTIDTEGITFLGIDPTIKKFKKYYPDHPDVLTIEDFFSAEKFKKFFNDRNRKAKIVTSIAMFYDLEDPIEFAKGVESILDDSGIWCFEQAYLGFILPRVTVDCVLAEHLLYYDLKSIKYILDKANLKIIDIQFNDTNAGSIRIISAKKDSIFTEALDKIKLIKDHEDCLGLHDNNLSIYKKFEQSVYTFKQDFVNFLKQKKEEGKTIYGLSASTKFNCIIQFCGIGPDLITAMGEVNEDKFGSVTPGSNIPIVPEDEVLDKQPDYIVIGAYHFRDFFINNEKIKKYISKGGKLVFPLPHLEIYPFD